MSEENLELVRRAYEALGPYPARVEESTYARWVAPDAEADLSAVYPDAPIMRAGPESVSRLVDMLPWGRSVKLKPERFFDVDDERVLVFIHVTAEGEGSGAPVQMRDTHELTVRDGLIVRLKVYADRTEALKAVGLRA
jgi:ketosteroid isomerase-like protein